MCEMDRFRILDPLKSQCAASAASLMYILTNNGYPEPTNILRPEIIPPVKNINNIVGSVFNENPFDGLNPTKPYIFYLNVNSNNSSIIRGNFTGHVSNLIYIPHPVLASASNLETIKFGKFYCIQSFIYLYNTQIKELSYDEFKKYVKIYLHRFNTSNPENFRALSYDRINVIEYLTVTWANNNDYYGNRLHGPVLDTRISVYEINDIDTVLSRLIKIIGYQHTYFKVILKYLNTYYNYGRTKRKI